MMDKLKKLKKILAETSPEVRNEVRQMMDKLDIENLTNYVYDYPTKYPMGFTDKEVKEIASKFPRMNKEKFDDALMCITCTSVDNETVIFHCDIETALRCGLQDRGMTQTEFD